MTVIRKILSKKGRAAIYALAVAVLGVAGIFGLVTADQTEDITTSLASLLTALAPILALLNLSDDPVEEEPAPAE